MCQYVISLGVNLVALSLTKRVQNYSIGMQIPNPFALILDNISQRIHNNLSTHTLSLKVFSKVLQNYDNPLLSPPYYIAQSVCNTTKSIKAP